MLRAGRGFGKTRVGAETVRAWARELGKGGRIALVARTAADVRDVIVEGESGILAISPPWFRPVYEPSKRRLTWPNGCMGITYSSQEPDILRGPQHHKAWCDEWATWFYLQETWDNLLMGLRLGKNPQCVITTTPRPLKALHELQAQPDTTLTTGTTYENLQNLSPKFRDTVIRRYHGTRLGRQELLAELLEDAEGAMWKRDTMIEAHRVHRQPEMLRIVVAIDPAVTSNKDSNETGIIVAGKGRDQRGYILQDISGIHTPNEWAKAAARAYDEWQADAIVGEANNGGDLVEANVRTVKPGARFIKVSASRAKQVRAEPIVALYEQGRISHVGHFKELEDEMCQWEPDSGMTSPSRLDAMVWAFTELDLVVGGQSLAEVVRTSVPARENVMACIRGKSF